MKKYLVCKDGHYYKANLHTHSTLSDGNLTPEELKREYKARGYSILAITDHEVLVDHSDLNDDSFLTITSYELYINEGGRIWNHTRTAHLNFYAKDPHNVTQVCYDPKYLFANAVSLAGQVKYTGAYYEREYTPECINEMIRLANENGFLVCYNHPAWSLENYEQYSRYEGIFAMEVFNTGCYREGYNDKNESVFDDLLRSGKRLFVVAADDAHTAYPIGSVNNDSFGGWIMVNCKNFDYSSVIDALQRGDFYASCGPEIHEVSYEDGKVHVECSPAWGVRFVTYGRHNSLYRNEDATPVTSCDFTTEAGDKYFRIEVIGPDGMKAYTNAFFLE